LEYLEEFTTPLRYASGISETKIFASLEDIKEFTVLRRWMGKGGTTAPYFQDNPEPHY